MVKSTSLTERISSNMKENGKYKISRIRKKSIFMNHANEIDAAIQNGFSANAIWKTLKSEGTIDYGYDTFLLFVKDYCPSYKEKSKPREKRQQGSSASNQSSRTVNNSLNFNSNPDPDDLF